MLIFEGDINRFIQFCRYLELDTSISSMADRIRLQKIFYILKNFNLDLNLKFTWYKHGPYSTHLADIYYYVNEHPSILSSDLNLSNTEILNLEKSKEFLGPIIDDTDLLEFYASILFVYKDMVFRKDERNQITYENKIKYSKLGLYNMFNYKESLTRLQRYGLI